MSPTWCKDVWDSSTPPSGQYEAAQFEMLEALLAIVESDAPETMGKEAQVINENWATLASCGKD